MIELLEQQSADAFGTVISNLDSESHDKVIVRCKSCGETFSREYIRAYEPHPCGDITQSWYKSIRMEFKRLVPEAKIPSRSRATDAGYDLYSVTNAILKPGHIIKVKTGIALACPSGYYYTIEGRSGLGSRGIIPFRGIIDAGYTGEIIVILRNIGTENHVIESGHRVAQICLQKIVHADITIVDEFSDKLVQRGESGFGSSGH